MKRINIETLHTTEPFGIVDSTSIPDETIPDLNVDLYEMLVRHQNGDISTLGGMIRRDAKYCSDDDCNEMRVPLENDPNFNLITAPYYLDSQQQRVKELTEEDMRNALNSKEASADPTETEQSEV